MATKTKVEKWLTVIPAYVRDYLGQDQVLAHWRAGKDFQIQDISCKWNGKYVNEADLQNGEYDVLKIRYNKLVDFVLLRHVNGEWVISGGN